MKVETLPKSMDYNPNVNHLNKIIQSPNFESCKLSTRIRKQSRDSVSHSKHIFGYETEDTNLTPLISQYKNQSNSTSYSVQTTGSKNR